jgi:MYND finger
MWDEEDEANTMYATAATAATAAAAAAAAAATTAAATGALPPCPVPLPTKALPTETACTNPMCPTADFTEADQVRCPCRGVVYCNRACQLANWPAHGPGCQATRPDKGVQWLDRAMAASKMLKKPEMRGISYVYSKLLGCPRTLTVKPDVRSDISLQLTYIFFILIDKTPVIE